MTSKSAAHENRFVSCSIHLLNIPESILKVDPVSYHRQEEAIAKIDRLCHRIYKVPITWLCSYSALQKYGEQLSKFHREYGDEVAIMEAGICSTKLLDGKTAEYQGWVEACGLRRPDEFKSKEPELRDFMGFHDMPYDQQRIALSYLKGYYDDVIGQNTRTLATAHTNGLTIRAMKEVGLDVSWGYGWNYFAEGINHKGCLVHPFYISEENHNVPDQSPGGRSVLAIHWGLHSPVISASVETHCRQGMPRYCLNAMEMTNRSEGLDKFRFQQRVIEEYMSQSTWNHYAYAPLQLEAVWLDETKTDLEQFPTFNSADTETFYSQLETALRLGARPVTLSGFADWHRDRVSDTDEYVYYSEDHLPDLRSAGKDQAYQPMVIYGDKAHQYWFSKARGFNYIRRYRYVPPIREEDIPDEYPFDIEPRVYLQIKRTVNMNAGITLTPDSAFYELRDFGLTAYDDDPDYAAVLWQANIPSYIKDADMVIDGAIKSIRTIREKNIAIVFAALKKGFNPMIMRSDMPSEYIKIQGVEKVGRRYEIWIDNSGDEVYLHTLKANLEPGLRIGGFWWDGFYNRTIFRYGWAIYDRETGYFELRADYPIALKINSGLTRTSVELL